MTDPFILSQLRARVSENESHIGSLSDRLANARSDLIHVMATIWMFDPSPEDAEPAKSYHSSARALTRAELFMQRFQRRKTVQTVGRRGNSTLWRLPG